MNFRNLPNNGQEMLIYNNTIGTTRSNNTNKIRLLINN